MGLGVGVKISRALDVGPAPIALLKFPPQPPLQLEDPYVKPQPFSPRHLAPSSPHPLALFAMLRERAAQARVGEGS